MSSAELPISSTRPISPINIPELLEHIFVFVDTKTLTTSVPLVSRQWFLISRSRSNRVFEWINSLADPNVDKAISRLQTADTLCCRLSEPWLKLNASTLDAKLWRAIEDNYIARHFIPKDTTGFRIFRRSTVAASERSIARGGALGLKSPELRQLLLEGFITMQMLSEHFTRYFDSLRILKIHTTHGSKNEFHVKDIMHALPSLETLHLQHTGPMNALQLPGSWIECSEESSPRTRHRLRSLIIINAWLPQASLEDFLSISPHLKELKLVLLQYPYKPGPFYDPKRLLRHIRDLSLDLTSFHYSDKSSLSDPVMERQLNFELCPQATHRTFRGAQFTPEVLRILDSLPNVLTTLELLGECKYLHEYLCESPFLVHLKAPLTDMPIQNLDIHMSGNTRPPRIWACRGLRSLQLLFRSGNVSLSDGEKNSRIIFGYISRVCPLLQVLEIYGSEVQMDDVINTSPHRMSLELLSGLVLLSRLRRLRRLQIGTSDPHKPVHLDLQAIDIDWMVPSGHTLEKRQKRQAVMDAWEGCIWADVKDHETGVSSISQVVTSEARQDLAGATPELEHRLRNLGHKMDVKLMLEEMHLTGSGYVCWPELEEVDFHQFYRALADYKVQGADSVKDNGAQVEALVKRLLPAHVHLARGTLAVEEIKSWLEPYHTRLVGSEDLKDDQARRAKMNKVNPAFVLRNWVAQRVIERVTESVMKTREKSTKEDPDKDLLDRVLWMCQHPFGEEDVDKAEETTTTNADGTCEVKRNDAGLEAYGEYVGPVPEWGQGIQCSCSS
ncbi:hypothetical protein BGW39_007926 [Mortierella sp. 14UC]|nr:hypothetical protein BGW39_007926 [Mortierella sp. 14UC]